MIAAIPYNPQMPDTPREWIISAVISAVLIGLAMWQGTRR